MAEFTKTVTVNCPYCESTHVVKNGLSPDKDQRYLCRRCSRRFTDRGGTDGLRFPPNQVGAAVRMFYSGMSYKQIAESMEEQYDIPEPSKATIYRWVLNSQKPVPGHCLLRSCGSTKALRPFWFP